MREKKANERTFFPHLYIKFFSFGMALLQQLHSILSPESSLDKFYTSSIPVFKMHRILAFVSHEAASADELKPETRETAQKAVYEAKGTHCIYRDTLGAVIHMLTTNGIEYILLKGASLWSYYPALHLREQDDIDILVHKKDLGIVMDIVKSTWGTADFETGAFHISCRLGSTPSPDLEVHTETGPAGLSRIRPDVLFSHTETALVDGLEINVLSFPFLVQHVSFHAANHRLLTRIQWLNDVKLLLESGDDLSFLRRLKGIDKRSCAAVFSYAHRIFQSSSLVTAEKSLKVSPLFLRLISKIVPPDCLFNNPVLYSSIRGILYHLLLIQNPLNIAKAAWGKIAGRGQEAS